MAHLTDLAALARDLDTSCRLEGEFTLRSGQVVAEYFDKYRFESDPALLRRVAEALVPLVPVGSELLGGLELGGVPVARRGQRAAGSRSPGRHRAVRDRPQR